MDTSFLKDEEKEIEEEVKKKALMNKFIQKHLETRKEILKLTYCYWDGSGKKRNIIIKKGDSVREVIQKCLKRLQKSIPDLAGATADTFMMVKADYIMPNHILLMDYLDQQKPLGKCQCGGKQEWQQCIFTVAKKELEAEELQNKEMFSDEEQEGYGKVTEVDVDTGPMCKIIERRVYEQNKYMFPYYNWKTFELAGYRS